MNAYTNALQYQTRSGQSFLAIIQGDLKDETNLIALDDYTKVEWT